MERGLVNVPALTEEVSLVLTPGLKAFAMRCFSEAAFRQLLETDFEEAIRQFDTPLTAEEINMVKIYLTSVSVYTSPTIPATLNDSSTWGPGLYTGPIYY
jgi:hypothetical protein